MRVSSMHFRHTNWYSIALNILSDFSFPQRIKFSVSMLYKFILKSIWGATHFRLAKYEKYDIFVTHLILIKT